MASQFSAHSVKLLADVVLLNRAIYGGVDGLQERYLADYEAGRDPDDVGNRTALNVYDRYDSYLRQFGLTTLSSTELGFSAALIGADETSDGLDHNYTYAGDLFRNNYAVTDSGEVAFIGAGAVALVALKDNGNGNTLHLTFRGTDADGPLADGEAGTANGQVRYYQQLRSLIDQVYAYASESSNKVSEIVVSGHSLGGTVADLFALYDGDRFATIDGVKLSVIALASAGVAPGVLALMPDYDSSLVSIGADDVVSFDTPAWYFQYDQANDIVRNPSQYDAARHLAEDPEQAVVTGVAVDLLRDHIHFEDNRLQFETPVIDQYAVSKSLETNFLVNHYADFYELIGTEFSKAWPVASAMNFDHFIALFGSSKALAGTPGSNNVNGWGVSIDNAADFGARQGSVFVLGLSGNDNIKSGSGNDFLAGGAGDDRLFSRSGNDIVLGDIRGEIGNDHISAGNGNDILLGGRGEDTLLGGMGRDRLEGGRGIDLLRGGAGSDSFIFTDTGSGDVITDFEAAGKAHDIIDLSAIEGIGNWRYFRTHQLDDQGASVVIEIKGDEIVTLRHTELADLTVGDFLF